MNGTFRRRTLRLRLLFPSIAMICRGRYGSDRTSTSSSNLYRQHFHCRRAIGIALSGTSLIWAFLVGFSYRMNAEVLQFGYVHLTASLFDIASNTCGAVFGYLAATFGVWLQGTIPYQLRFWND